MIFLIDKSFLNYIKKNKILRKISEACIKNGGENWEKLAISTASPDGCSSYNTHPHSNPDSEPTGGAQNIEYLVNTNAALIKRVGKFLVHRSATCLKVAQLSEESQTIN